MTRTKLANDRKTRKGMIINEVNSERKKILTKSNRTGSDTNSDRTELTSMKEKNTSFKNLSIRAKIQTIFSNIAT